MAKYYVHLEQAVGLDDAVTIKVTVSEAELSTATVSLIRDRFVEAFRKKLALDLKTADVELLWEGRRLDNNVALSSIPSGSDVYVSLLVLCARNGCGMRYKPEENHDDACAFHAGSAIFHEGTKGWSCCGKRVLTFEEFLAIPTCARGRHEATPLRPIQAAPTPAPASSTAPTSLRLVEKNEGVERYEPSKPAATTTAPSLGVDVQVREEVPDPLDAPIEIGARCLHTGCNATFQGDHSRTEECRYHPGVPLFHEGTKKWTCCKSGSLIFEDFLNAPPCKVGRHKFLSDPGAAPKDALRKDWYQMGDFVTAAVYVKGAKPETTAQFIEDRIILNIIMPDGNFRTETILLNHAIEPDKCTCKVLSTKIEMKLKKKDRGDWTALERSQ